MHVWQTGTCSALYRTTTTSLGTRFTCSTLNWRACSVRTGYAFFGTLVGTMQQPLDRCNVHLLRDKYPLSFAITMTLIAIMHPRLHIHVAAMHLCDWLSLCWKDVFPSSFLLMIMCFALILIAELTKIITDHTLTAMITNSTFLEMQRGNKKMKLKITCRLMKRTEEEVRRGE